MMQNFKKFTLNKYFLIWILIFLSILYLFGGFLIVQKKNLMLNSNIEDLKYCFYSLLLPMSFFDDTTMWSFLIDCCYLSILSYVVIQFVDRFFIKNPSVTFNRVGRKKWIKKVILFNFIYAFLFNLLYIFFCYIICFKKNILFTFELSSLIPLIYKTFITILIPNIYLLCYIKTDNAVTSTIFYILIYILFELVIRMTFVNETLKFNYAIWGIFFLFIMYIIICKITLNAFEMRDLG